MSVLCKLPRWGALSELPSLVFQQPLHLPHCPRLISKPRPQWVGTSSTKPKPRLEKHHWPNRAVCPINSLRSRQGPTAQARVCPFTVVTCDGQNPWPGPVRAHVSLAWGPCPAAWRENIFVSMAQETKPLKGTLDLSGSCPSRGLKPTELTSMPAGRFTHSSPRPPPGSLLESLSPNPPGQPLQPLSLHCPQVPANSRCPTLQLFHPPASQVLGDRG